VILADRSLIGRGGATVMAQMTVAVALGEQTPDSWEYHLADTLAAGRGLCNESLSAMLCQDGPARIREMDAWKVGWAREDDHIAQIHAPGHDRARCVYVDVLSTGPAVSRTLRTQLNLASGIRRIGDLAIVDIVVRDGRACGAVAVHLSTGETVTLAANVDLPGPSAVTRSTAAPRPAPAPWPPRHPPRCHRAAARWHPLRRQLLPRSPPCRRWPPPA
jgi:succinate dehydrogenase/fumarate reductase flavoprotein subunit